MLRDELTPRLTRGMGYLDAANDVDLGAFGSLPLAGRMVINAYTMQRLLFPDTPTVDIPTLFTQVAHYEAARG
jgi:hypothetical protein